VHQPSAGALIARARQGQPTAVRHWLGLLAYAVGFAVLALWGYRRDEGTSYR
jgi:hypothetical protein